MFTKVRTHRPRQGRRGLCLAVVGLGALAPTAAAQPTLDGETLTGTPTSTITCDADGRATSGTYSVSGQASGPYPGTFSERGGFSRSADGHIGRLEATFTIRSGAT